MPNFLTWLQDPPPYPLADPVYQAQVRAIYAWQHINESPTVVTFRTPSGDTLAAQIVRVESDSSANTIIDMSGTGPRRQIVLFGVENHPTIADTVVEEGYRFNMDNDQYRVIDVIHTMGEVQALVEAVG